MKHSLRGTGAGWRSFLLPILIFVLAQCVRADQISFLLRASKSGSTQEGNLFFGADLDLSSTNTPITYDQITSPNGLYTASIGPGGTSGGWAFPNNISNVLTEFTNGLWTLVINAGSGSPQTNYFTVSLNGLTTNDLPDVLISSPANGAVDVASQPLCVWTGPTNFSDLQVDAHNDNYSFYDGADLPLTTNNWTPYDLLPYGFNSLDVNYYAPTAKIVLSTPTNSLGQPMTNWDGTGGLHVSDSSRFFVGAPPPLVARYTFDNTNNLGADSSGNGNDSNGSAWDGPAALTYTNYSVEGGEALLCPGDNWLDLPQPVVSAIEGSFSVAVWLETTNLFGNDTDAATSGAGLFSAVNNGDSTNDCIPMAQTGGKLAFYTGDSQTTLHSTASINTGSFVHLVVTRDLPSGTRKIYVNGVLDNQDLGGTNLLANCGGLTLDFNWSSFAGFVGVVDDLQIYDGAIGDSNALYLFQNPGQIVTNIPVSPLNLLGQALNATNLNWATFGDASWFVETTNTQDGVSAAQSGSVTNSQSSTISATVTGPGTLTFYWSSIANDPSSGFYCEFYLDGDALNNNVDSIYGDNSWYQDGPFPIPAGQHTLDWTVFADGDTDPTQAAFLDEVSYAPDTLPVITLNPFSQTNYSGYPVWLSASATGNPPPTWQWYQVGVGAISGATSSFYIPTNSGAPGVAGSYYAVATNLAGSATTLTAAVTFVSAPLPPGWSVAVKSPLYAADDGTNVISDYYGGCAVDSAGDVYAADQYIGNVNVETNFVTLNTLTALGTYGGAALVKYDPDGKPLWVAGLTNNQLASYSYALCVAPAPANGAYLAAVLFGTNWLGSNQFSNTGGASLLLSRFDAGGSNIWSRFIGKTNGVFDLYNTLVSDAAGNVTVAGIMSGTVDFGGTNLTAPGQMGFLAQYDANGVVRWASVLPDFPVNLACGGGQIYLSMIASSSGGVTNLSIGSLSNLTDRAYGLAALNASTGQPLWLRGVGEQYAAKQAGIDDDFPLLSVAGSDVFLTGTAYGSTAVFGSLSVSLPGGRAQYFARYDTNGNAQVASTFGGATTMPWASAANASGVYVSGDFDNFSYFGNDLIAAPEYYQNDLGSNYFSQPFVAKFDRNGNPLWALNGVSPYEANFRGIAAASDGVWASGFNKIVQVNLPAQFGTNSVYSDGYLYYYGTGVAFFSTTGGLLAKITESPVASPVTLLNPQRVGTNVQFSFFGASSVLYTIQTSTNLASRSWSVSGTVMGSNSTQTISTPIPPNTRALFIRVKSD